MADSNSKKPMALLLLVVVAVLVVIMVNRGGDDFAGHAALTADTECTDAGGTWAKAVTLGAAATCLDAAGASVVDDTWDGTEATCTTATGTFTAKGDDSTADAETCQAPDWTSLDEAGCEKAHGTFTAAVTADDTADPKVAAADAKCDAWVAESTD